MIQFDTSFLIRALVRDSREDQRLRRWLAEARLVGISTIAWAEFLCGPIGESEIELAHRIVGEPIPFTPTDGATAADLFNRSGRRRGSFLDCLIAAPAVSAGAELATANEKDFRRFETMGLRLAHLG